MEDYSNEPKVFQDLIGAVKTANTIIDPRERQLFIRQSVFKRSGCSHEQARLLALLEHGAQTGDFEALNEALAGGLTAETKLWSGTVLAEAMRHGQTEVVRELLRRGANPNGSSENHPVLFHATSNSELLSVMIAAGADVHVKYPNGLTMLAAACGNGAADCVRLLLEAGAKVDEACNRDDLRGGVAQMTPLMLTCMFGEAKIAKLLMARGADLNLRDAEGHTALNWAQMKTSKRFVKLAEMLIKAGATAGRPVVDLDAPEPDFRKAAKDPRFLAMVERLKEITGKAQKRLQGAEGPIRGGVGSLSDRAKEIVAQHQMEFLEQGCYLFSTRDLLDRNGDAVALLPTVSVYEAIAAVQTEGPNSDIYTGDLIRWLKGLEEPLRITGFGSDYLEGKFTGPIKDPAQLAKKVAALCPDGAEGPDAERILAQRLENTGVLFLWWD